MMMQIETNSEVKIDLQNVDDDSSISYHEDEEFEDDDQLPTLSQSQTMHQEAVNKYMQGGVLSWKNLSVKVGEKVILDNLNGITRPGKITAIMGHSGCGKTTLLKTLVGRFAHTEGDISFNDIVIEPKLFTSQKRVAFVAQTDSLDPTSTVYESIEFSAKLRVGLGLDRCKEDQEWLEKSLKAVINDVQLNKCQDTETRFLSGGERRRLSMAIELIANPSIMILDEPTSGLDSYNAVNLLECLRKIASTRGTNILLSLHQPNLVMFNMIDNVILLHGGRCMLRGAVRNIPKIFDTHNLPVPDQVNPADWMLEISQIHDVKELETEYKFFQDEEEGFSKRDLLRLQSMSMRLSMKSNGLQYSSKEMARVDNEQIQVVSPFIELVLLLQRDCRRRTRYRILTFLQLVIPAMCGLFLGLAYINVAGGEIDSPVDFQGHLGSVFLAFLGSICTVPGIMMDFVEQRPLFEREYRTHHYGIISHAISKIVTDFLSVAVQGLLISLSCFWTLGLQSRFWYFTLNYTVFSFSLVSLSILMGSAVTDLSMAKEFIGLALFPQTLLSGFFVPVESLPSFIRWAAYTMPLTFSFRILLEEEFRFCGAPKTEKDKHLLSCLDGLKHIFNEETVLSNETRLTLVQTGIYNGRDGAEEYIRLTSGSPKAEALLYDICPISNKMEFLIQEVSESYCRLTAAFPLRYRVLMGMNPDYTHEIVYGWHLEYQTLSDNKALIFKQDAFFNPFIENVFGFKQEEIVPDICDTLENSCGEEYFQFQNQAECIKEMSDLPVYEENLLGYYTYIGNNTGCRIIHAQMAKTNPNNHCPHVSFESQKDKKGEFKCDRSTKNDVYYNYTEDEWNLFQKAAINNDIYDPTMSRVVPNVERSECITVTKEDLVPKVEHEFEELDLTCYGFLQVNDATSDLVGIYWVCLICITFFYRLVGGFALHNQAMRYK